MNPEGDYKVMARVDGKECFVDIAEITDDAVATDSTEIGEMAMRVASPITVTMSVKLLKASIIRCVFEATGITNNYLRQQGSKPIRFRTLRRAEKKWS